MGAALAAVGNATGVNPRQPDTDVSLSPWGLVFTAAEDIAFVDSLVELLPLGNASALLECRQGHPLRLTPV